MNADEVPRAGLTCRWVVMVAPFPVARVHGEVGTGHRGQCVWGGGGTLHFRSCRGHHSPLAVAESGPPLCSAAPVEALNHMPLSLFVTLSPSIGYGPEEGRTLGMGMGTATSHRA